MFPTRHRAMIRRIIFQAWKGITISTLNEALKTEVERLQDMVGRQRESVWLMRKEQLIQLARQELDMPRYIAEKETVVSLRERLRKARAEREAHSQPADPQAILPRGLDKMSREDLVQECVKRGINPENAVARNGKTAKTRPEMIVAIRDHVAACQERQEPPRRTSSPSRARSASIKRREAPNGGDPMVM